ncbi:MAG: UDP-N-acetylmuramoyl-L-alanyl-D-glutamate--2,6-diaminopimelate ligase [Candidatus Moranbacteria bacterium]|nr:UDP-N-acetylmuramoyl-L-alanyl-D-glutamate--2,6-diaminopimelate ligase [Candidatus Moranbacteria bacterium]
MKKIIPQSIKNIYHLLQAVFANIRFGFSSKKLKIIGVTGTNGKTTTVQMIAKILEEANFKVAVASTINFKLAKKEWVNKSKFTTLSSWALQKFLREAVAAGCEYAVLEVSSHSLDQNRVWGTDFDVVVITNVTREHLDYHETMEEYAKAKERLLEMVSKNRKGASVVNLNTKFAENFLKYTADKKYGYFLESQNPNCILGNGIQLEIARDIKLSIGGSVFSLNGEKFKLNIPGEFNIENALAATCVGLSQNIPLEKNSAALGKIKGVPGRMERIENDRGIEIIVDYAVTPDSLEKLYGYISKIKKENSKVIAVFGSCGERDRGKRPIMGEIVAKRADFAIVTNEDPYHEDPQQIIDEVFAGVKKRKRENENTWRILDRREAIKKALQIAKPGDILVVTGKGAEEVMAVGDKRIPWNDPRVIREVLREQ